MTPNALLVLLVCWNCFSRDHVIAELAAKHVPSDSLSVTSSKTEYIRNHIFLGHKDTAEDPSLDEQYDEEEFLDNFLDYYQYGVKSYLSNDWAGCVESLERAIAGYWDFYAATASCRIKCQDVAKRVPPFYADDVDDMHYYESVIRRTLCLVKCKRVLMPTIGEFFQMNQWSQDVFVSRKPYTYLQICYYKTGDMIKAASATYTALLRNADDTMMSKNLQFYLDKMSKDTILVDLDQKKFASFYMDGLRAYNADNYSDVIVHMEQSLPQYSHDLNECRAFCEGEHDQNWLPDFVTSVGNHFTHNLKCKQNCTRELSFIHGRRYDDVFASHYEYLQFSYFKLDKTEEACRAAASFLLIHPDSTEMQANLAYYQKGKLAACKPRKESELFFDRQRYEQRLLQFISIEFAPHVLDAPWNIDMNDALNIENELRQN